MRAISLWQPWATLIAIGAKQYETRSWNVSFRGEIAIHAARTANQLPIAKMHPFCDVLAAAGFTHPSMLPLGAVLCVAEVVDCIRVEMIRSLFSSQEKAFGNYADDRYAWMLANVRVLATPIPASGQQGIWDWHIPSEATWIDRPKT